MKFLSKKAYNGLLQELNNAKESRARLRVQFEQVKAERDLIGVNYEALQDTIDREVERRVRPQLEDAAQQIANMQQEYVNMRMKEVQRSADGPGVDSFDPRLAPEIHARRVVRALRHEGFSGGKLLEQVAALCKDADARLQKELGGEAQASRREWT